MSHARAAGVHPAIFDSAADLYDRARPRYPEAVFDKLAMLAELDPGARLLEIGCGTGQATVPLARRHFAVTCVELGERLAEVARKRLTAFPDVRVVTADFETWQPAEAAFDVVVAFTALHWIAPTARYAKPALLLRNGGHLAVVTTAHVLPANGDPFFAAVQDDYIELTPDADEEPPPPPDAVPDLSEEIAASGYFRNVGAQRWVWDISYSAEEYITLLSTYSGHRALSDEVRARLYERIRTRIAERPSGTVRKSYLATLNVARKMSLPATSARLTSSSTTDEGRPG